MRAIPLVSIGFDKDGVELFAPAHLRPSASAPRLIHSAKSEAQNYDLWASLGAVCLLTIAMVARAYILGA